MNTVEIITAFNQHDQIPYKAILSAIEHKEEITPALLAFFKNSIKNYKAEREEGPAFLISLALLAQFREKAAFDDLISLISLPEEHVEELLGLFSDELPTFIVSLYNGDLAAIKALIENTKISVTVRGAALNSLLGLFAIEKMSREELIAYHRSLLTSSFIEDEDFLSMLIDDIYALYPKELHAELIALLTKKEDCSLFVTKESVEELLNEYSQEDHLEAEIYSNIGILPVYNAIPLIENLYEGEMDEENLEDFMSTLEIDEEEDSCCQDSDKDCCDS